MYLLHATVSVRVAILYTAIKKCTSTPVAKHSFSVHWMLNALANGSRSKSI